MTVDCTGFTEPLPCPHTTLQACVQRARPQQRTNELTFDFIVFKIHWINDDDIVPDINPLMIDTGKY